MNLWLRDLFLISSAFFVFFMYSPFLEDFQVNPHSNPFRDFTGPLEENYKLSEAERISVGEPGGPESIVFHEGYLYTGLQDGRIVKIKDGKVTTVARTGVECDVRLEAHKCGRPLGMRKGKDGLLYFCDAFYGIFTMNFTTGALNNILPISTKVEGTELILPDDLDVDDEGNIYFSDASKKYDLSRCPLIMFENEAGGRIIRYNVHSKKTEVVAKDLHFPNGVQLSKDGKSLLVNEITNRRILRIYLKGAQKGKIDVFADALPGEPDNIRPSSRGGYWVAFGGARNSSNPLILDRLSEYPSVKRFYARVHLFFSNLLVKLSEYVDNYDLKVFAHELYQGGITLKLFNHHGLVVEFDENGQILRSFHSPDGKFFLISEVTEHDGYLYIGTIAHPFLGRLRL